MTTSVEYTEYVLELLDPIGPLTTRRFFGGVGIRAGSVQFAMVMRNSLYFAVDDATRAHYVGAGMGPFSYQTAKGVVRVNRYFELPEDVLHDPERLRAWSAEAIRVASESKKRQRSQARTGAKRPAPRRQARGRR